MHPTEPSLLEQITPLVLTYNEAPNIGRVLDRLAWAARVVVLDSFSNDETESIAKGYPNVAFVRRAFDCHANQWNFGLRETGIDTEWVLALDADYVLPEGFLEELRRLGPPAGVAGYRAGFRYCIEGVPLRGTVYTPVTVLFRKERAEYWQDGHTQRLRVDGEVSRLSAAIHHDDRKSLDRWFRAQVRYMDLEAEAILRVPLRDLDLADRLRRAVFVAPIAMFAYCLFVKGTLLDGRRGFLYACQRAIAELILSLLIVERLLRPGRLPDR
jgi:glycosyltransferase involved in cell wall biosynthesis